MIENWKLSPPEKIDYEQKGGAHLPSHPRLIFIHISYAFDSQDVNGWIKKRRRLKKEEKGGKRRKIAIKREQTKACFQFAERERFIQK